MLRCTLADGLGGLVVTFACTDGELELDSAAFASLCYLCTVECASYWNSLDVVVCVSPVIAGVASWHGPVAYLHVGYAHWWCTVGVACAG